MDFRRGWRSPDEVKEAFAHFCKDLARGYRLTRGLRETVVGRLSDLMEIEKKKGKKGETEETAQDVACQPTTWRPRMRSATWERTSEEFGLQKSSCVGFACVVVCREAGRCGGFLDRTSVARPPRFFPAVFAYSAVLVRDACGNPNG